MLKSSRMVDLLEEALTTERLPEDICIDCPELLPELRRQMKLCKQLDSEIECLFPSTSTPEPWDESAPTPEIDGYVISSVLGRGGAGIVYRAQQVSLERDVAIKMLLVGRYGTKAELRRLSREAQAIGRLRHPNIVQVYDVGSVGGQPYFTMELIENGTLAKRINNRPLKSAEAAALLITLADAIEAAHCMGIVHRDLKPSNILMSAEGAPKIADFGLARHFNDDLSIPTLSAHVGTPSYMAPEQVRGTRDATNPRVDVYALGAILYECLTGQPPFRGETAAHTHQQVLTLDPIPPSRLAPQLPRDLETICLKCLSKTSTQRYTSAGALAADVRRFLSHQPITARPVSRLERINKWAKRHPALATAMTAAAAVLIGGSITLMRLRAFQQDRQRAIDADLVDVAAYESREQWTNARQVLQRDLAAIDSSLSSELGQRLRAAERDLDFVAQLDAIHLERVTAGNLPIYRMKADARYRKTFESYLSVKMGDPVDAAAAVINRSPVKGLLAVAVNDWVITATGLQDRRWLLDVAKLIQPADRDGWLNRICDADHWAADVELKELARKAPVARVPISVLLILAERLKASSSASASEFLRRVQRENPSDFWVNLQLGTDFLWQNPNIAEAFCRAALARRPDAAVGYTALADALRSENHPYDAIAAYHKALKLEPESAWTRNNCGNALADIGRFEEALAYHDQALKNDPQYAWADYDAGDTLMKMNRAAEAVPRYEKVVHSSLNDLQAQRNLRTALIVSGRADEAMKSWQDAMTADPWNFDVAAGYAEACAYLQRHGEYEEARKHLLQMADHCADNNSTIQAIISTCLLEPASDDVLDMISDLLANHKVRWPPKPTAIHSRYRFNLALLAFRQHRAKDAVETLTSTTFDGMGPSPRLLLAMAQFDLGNTYQAKDLLADLSFHYDWRPANMAANDFGKHHVLRREAESILMPNNAECLRLQQPPAERFDRLTLVGACVEKGMNAFAARLCADAFVEDPTLGRHAGLTVRFRAACAAVASGDPQRRTQAQRWLADDLALELTDMPTPGSQACARLENQLGHWRTDPDLASARDPDALQRLPFEERQAWQTLWHDVSAAMDRLESSG